MASPCRSRPRAGRPAQVRPALRAVAAARLGVAALGVAALGVAGPALAQDPEPAAQATPTPGSDSTVEASGWNGRTALVRHVEGAVPGAPLRIADKPRPQHDWYVQEFPGRRPDSLNVYASRQPGAAAVSRSILDRLIEVDPDHPPQVVGGLAVSWEVSDGGQTCTYALRKGVQFADGRPFTSADVVFSFAVLSDPAVEADQLRPALETVKSVTAPDEHTVVATYRHPSWRAVHEIGNHLPVLNKAWYEEELPRTAQELGIETFSTTPGEPGFADVFNRMVLPCPGTGPYYLRTGSDYGEDYVHLSQNPFSWRMQVHPRRFNLAGLRWIELVGDSASYHAFTSGGLDVWVVPHSVWENQLSRDVPTDAVGRHFVYDHIGLDCSLIAWNCRKPPFDDARVRRAMTHLLDREQMLWRLDEGHGRIATCRSKPSYPSYSNFIEPHPYDPARALALLRRAGWTDDKDGDGIIEKDGKEFEFDLLVPAGSPYLTGVGEHVQDACRRAGIAVRVSFAGSDTFVKRVQSFRFQAVAGYSSWPDPWIDLYPGYHSSQDKRNGSNVSGWNNEAADELLEAMRRELDDDAREDLHHRFNRLFHEEQPETLLIHGKVGVLINKRFEGVSVRPTGLQSFDLWVRPENVLHGPAAASDEPR